MPETRSFGAAAAVLLFTAAPVLAGPCTSSIDELQRRVDSAIENQAASTGWRPESLSATRSRQPTPGSIAASEGAAGKKFKHVLALLNRARSADRAGNLHRCNAELDKARSTLDAM